MSEVTSLWSVVLTADLDQTVQWVFENNCAQCVENVQRMKQSRLGAVYIHTIRVA